MWLHVPKTTPASSLESAASTSPSESLCQTLAVSAMWRQKFPLPRIWRLVFKRNPWMTRLSGVTSEPSMADRGVALWMESLRASRAQTIALRESGKELSESTETSGMISGDAFARLNPSGFFSKTSPVSLFHMPSSVGDGIVKDESGRSIYFLPDSDSFLETWPEAGSMLNGDVYQQPRLALRTEGSGGSAWPTARAEDSECCGNHPGALDSLGGQLVTGTPLQRKTERPMERTHLDATEPTQC